jgi:ABC-type transport system involved in Fe-S cluster assembly fused permease/ATPase subunit
MASEFVFLCGTLAFTCGWKYLANMILTCALYTFFTNSASKKRIVQIKDKMNLDKRQEFY